MNTTAIPSKTRVVRLDEVGAPENLKLVEVSTPAVGEDDVLIKVALAGLIYGDTEARRGTYFTETLLPFFPGREVAGEVVAVGNSVDKVAVGDRVIALILTGACCADYVLASTKAVPKKGGGIIPPADIVKIPTGVAYEAALPYLINFRLAHLLFHGSSRVATGSNVLVHGGAGGMGSMTIQLAHAHRCFVIATCRTNEEADFCRRLGANEVLLAGETDLVETVRALTKDVGIQFSFNGVGGETLNQDFDMLAPFGEVQAYGYVAGKTKFDVFRLGKSISLKTFSADNYIKTPMFAAATAAMLEWFTTGPLVPVDVILPLSDVVEANRLLDQGRVIGKIALRP
jgi:NADPH2:quinone reductase